MNEYKEAWELLEEAIRLCKKHDVSLESEQMQNLMDNNIRIARQKVKAHKEKLDKKMEEGYKELAKEHECLLEAARMARYALKQKWKESVGYEKVEESQDKGGG